MFNGSVKWPLMADDLCIAITGTPGTGKTSICDYLQKKGFTIYSVKKLAEENECLGEIDSNDDSAPVDIHELADKWQCEDAGIVFIDGHLSHLLDVEAIVVLRCSPATIDERLKSREYTKEKIAANVEWEMISGVWSEMLEFEIESPCLELDSNSKAPKQLAEEILDWIEEGCQSLSVEDNASRAIDWLSTTT
ncbi:MAG: AAA family ATPase [Euryarchaeota archaeon]|nr:AAA family ATPase [Euryarchaeota archaeon]